MDCVISYLRINTVLGDLNRSPYVGRFNLGHEKNLCNLEFICCAVLTFLTAVQMFQTVAATQQTTQLWMWKMEYLHHEQRPLYFGEWF